MAKIMQIFAKRLGVPEGSIGLTFKSENLLNVEVTNPSEAGAVALTTKVNDPTFKAKLNSDLQAVSGLARITASEISKPEINETDTLVAASQGGSDEGFSTLTTAILADVGFAFFVLCIVYILFRRNSASKGDDGGMRDIEQGVPKRTPRTPSELDGTWLGGEKQEGTGTPAWQLAIE